LDFGTRTLLEQLPINKIKGNVFDSHLGSGSNRIANELNGNNFYACEIDKDKFILPGLKFNRDKIYAISSSYKITF
jgi:DNA modification methylase